MTDAPATRTEQYAEEYLTLHRRLAMASWRVAAPFFDNWSDREGVIADAVDETLVIAVARWGRVRRAGNPEAWVALQTLRTCRRLARREGRAGRQPFDDPLMADLDHPDAATVDVGAALGKLRRKERDILVLRHWEGMPEVDIASYLGTDVETVSRRLVEARGRLREALGRDPF